MTRILYYLALFMLATACAGHVEDGPVPAAGVTAGTPVMAGNLTIYPLYLAAVSHIPTEYISLENGLEQDTVQVREKGSAETGEAAGTVNAVEVANDSDKPLYLLSGQVIVGGKQDRAIARDAVVPPGETMEVEVCCVEHGRWAPGGSGGLFLRTGASSVNSEIKKTLVESGREGQQEVWSGVRTMACMYDASSATGTFHKVLEKTRADVDGTVKLLEEGLGEDGSICGFLACINGKVQTCDLFASPGLLTLFRENLLRGYALDALSSSGERTLEAPDDEAVRAFLEELMNSSDRGEMLAQSRHARLEKRETKNLVGFLNAVPCGTDIPEIIHVNAFRKE